jgi:Linear amide C-N hydrolases, choloylglycine hydrolase family
MRKQLRLYRSLLPAICLFALLIVLAGCRAGAVTPAPVPPTASLTPPPATPKVEGLSEQEAATLDSLKKVDDYPLYTMHYYGAYGQRAWSDSRREFADVPLSPAWACSLFAALGDANNMLYGRNFDWEYSPALLLYTHPPDGYASLSMVDIAYLGFGGDRVSTVADLPLTERRALLRAPFLPFDGMNERGLAVGMAAVPPGDVKPDPDKDTLDSLMVIRMMLDHAGSVDEAVAILQRYNVDMEGGPPLHYLIADRSGRAALVEFYQGKLFVTPNQTPWHQATNFLLSAFESPEGQCQRYDAISRQLAKTQGSLGTSDAIKLLEQVSQPHTQWSITYGLTTGDVNVVMGRQYSSARAFHLDPGNP